MHEIGDSFHNKSKILHKTSIKLYHTIEILYLFGTCMLMKACMFFGLGNLPSLKTIKPKIIPKKIIKAHLFKLKLIPYS
jgi:hypothetical protein